MRSIYSPLFIGVKKTDKQPVSANIEKRLWEEYRAIFEPLGIGFQNFISKCMVLAISDPNVRQEIIKAPITLNTTTN
jgi:hypothetical protein